MSNIQSVFLLYLWNRNLCDMTSVHLLLIQLSLMSFITLLLGFFGQNISHEQWINHLLWTGQWITTPSSSQSWLMTSLSSLLLNIHSLIGSISWTTRQSHSVRAMMMMIVTQLNKHLIFQLGEFSNVANFFPIFKRGKMSKSNPVRPWRFGRTRALIFTQKWLNRAKIGVLLGTPKIRD